tara:strand:- start:350 stop:1237 length:888 start_codon:yes stop_codon:yes gene_type:complete
MKIIDCVTYLDENMLLDIRLNVLNQYVDKFVIAESLYTHSGKKKKQNFDINNFPKFKDKIHYILVEDEVENLHDTHEGTKYLSGNLRLNSLKRIEKQYNSLDDGIVDSHDEDLILLSDCDEIPNLENLKKENLKNEIILFKQKIFYYKFNLQHLSMEWFGTKACRKKDLKTFNWLRNIKNKKYQFWRLDTFFSNNKYINVKTIENGGWHFSKVKNEKDIYYTLSVYGEHNEFEKSGLDHKKIKELIDNQELYFDHNLDKTSNYKYSSKIKLTKQNLDVLPKYLRDNHSKYSEWLA